MFRSIRPLLVLFLVLLPLTIHCSFFFPENPRAPIIEESKPLPPLPCGDKHAESQAFIPFDPIQHPCTPTWDWAYILPSLEDHFLQKATTSACEYATTFHYRDCCQIGACTSHCRRPMYFYAFTDALRYHTPLFFNYTMFRISESDLRIELTNQRPVLLGFTSDIYAIEFGILVGYERIQHSLPNPQNPPHQFEPPYRYHVLFPNEPELSSFTFLDLVHGRDRIGKWSNTWYRFSKTRDGCHLEYPDKY